MPEMFRGVSKLHTMRFINRKSKEGEKEPPMSNDKNSETPAEDTRTQAEKESDQTIMYLRMAIKQLQSRDWRVVSSSFGTVPVAVGENKKGLVRYQSQIATITISMDTGESVPTPFDQTPADAAKEPTEVKN